MADDGQVLRGISWREAFPFTHIFRSFRIAVHPSKLVLALLTILLLYGGGRLLDAVWSRQWRAVPNEIALYERAREARAFSEARLDARKAVESAAARRLESFKDRKEGAQYKTYDAALKYVQDQPDNANDDLEFEARRDLEEEKKAAEKRHEELKQQAQSLTNAEQKETALKESEKERTERIQRAYSNAMLQVDAAEELNGQGLFEAFFEYQTRQVNNLVNAVLAWNWLGGISEGAPATDGVAMSAYKFFTVAPAWALRHHWVYFLLFGALFLVVWSLFGGAIARIAAVHVADEGRKLSVRQGLGFAMSKFLSFLSAPLIPLIIIVGIGLLVAAAGLIMWIPYVGEIVVGVFFFLALAAGFVMTLVLLGMAGGFNLMYPTIAVEGSDSFDAISRSFSYVYARPWRMLFYSAVAIAYGALTYLFIRLFIWLMLTLTHFFVGLLVWRNALNGADLWTAIFPTPSWSRLPYAVNGELLQWGGSVAAFLISFWVYLVIAMLGAFAISFYFSANTIIYYLMRREVDATEMDDVYLEAPEEDFAENPVAPAVTSGTPATGAATTALPQASAETPPPAPAGGAAGGGGAQIFDSPGGGSSPPKES